MYDQEKKQESAKKLVTQKPKSKYGHEPSEDDAPHHTSTKQTAQLQALVDDYIDQKHPIQKKNNTGLPDQLKSGIEHLSGYSMDDVKVHYNSDKPAQLQAHAYAQGNQIHLAPGQEKHLPHEAWHVVQQKQGRVKPTKQLKDNVNINDDEGLEKEADRMGSKALVHQDSKSHQLQRVSIDPTVQRVKLIHPTNTTDEQIVQAKITIGSAVYDKKGSKATLALKERMKNYFGGENWKRGWIKYMTEAAGAYQEIPEGPFSTEQELADELAKKFPVSLKGSAETQFMVDAFRQSDLSLTGFIWRVLKSGYTLNDNRGFTKADLMKAMSTSDGKKFLGDYWRDTNNAVHGNQVIQGKHEWILTSNLTYVIEHAQNIKDLEIWFMAAEILRTPTQSVVFDFNLKQDEVDYLVNIGGKLSDLGKVGAHPGALYEERDDLDVKKQDPKKHNKQAVQGSSLFHARLENLLKTYLNPQKNDIAGYLQGLLDFHDNEIWSGTISGKNANDFDGVDTGFYSSVNKGSQKKDQDMKAFMLRQQQNFSTDRQVLINQAKAILHELNSVESSKNLAVDTKKLAELDEDSKYDVEVYFEEIDKAFKVESQKLAHKFQNLVNQHPTDFIEIEQVYKKEWQQLYDSYIQAKSDRLEETYKQVMTIS